MYSISLTIRKDDNGLFVEGVSSEPGLAGGVRVSTPIKIDLHSINQLLVRDLNELRKYGNILGEAVFTGDIRTLFHEVLAQVPRDDVLHISLSVEDLELSTLRWERMCCPIHNRKDSRWEFLHLHQDTAFSLDLRSSIDRRYPSISRVGLKALIVVADLGPTKFHKLASFDAAETVAGIRTALGKDIPCHVLACSGALLLPGVDGAPTLDEICRWLTRERFAILHIVCHGEFKQWEEPGENGNQVIKSDTFLYLTRSNNSVRDAKDGHVARVSGTEFIERLSQCQALPHLTFLCSCSSASPMTEKGFDGLGQRLVRELAMPAVVAMTEPVPIDLATEISKEFYYYLRQTGEVDRSLTKASASQAGRSTVLVPAHFSRLAGRRLFDDSENLTHAEWNYGLEQLGLLIQQRAPVLESRFKELLKTIQPALDICQFADYSKNLSEDEGLARDKVLRGKAELNELCKDFLENSFDHLAKKRPLAFPNYDTRCPFPGLGVFDKIITNDKEEDFRPFFFGREELVRELCDLLAKNRFLAVLGPSGSGKSSLIRAGLLSALLQENKELKTIIFPPGKSPVVRLQTELAAVPNPDILVVDQFEELFTICVDLPQRKEFLKQLLPLRDRFPVVLTMRTEFLNECVNEHSDLHMLFNSKEPKYLELLPPLQGEQLRMAIRSQLRVVELEFEPGLEASIFEELEGEPGEMPLLQHCLRLLWERRHGRWLRLIEYANKDSVGGVKGAISRTAETVYHQLVAESPDSNMLLQYIFERLTRIDLYATDLTPRRDTRRREALSGLTPDGGDERMVKLIVNKLADAKLVVTTLNPETHFTEVEVAHETLIRNWPRLQLWLDEARETAPLVERIRNDADRYQDAITTDNLTLRGSALEESLALLNARLPRLSTAEADFVRSCKDYENRKIESNMRRQRTTIVSLIIVSVVISGLALFAWHSSIIAQNASEEARKRFVRMSTISGIAARDRGDNVLAAHFFENAAAQATDLRQRDRLYMAAFHLVKHVSLQSVLSHQDVTGVHSIDDSQQLMTWGRDGNIKLWDLEGNQVGNSMPHDSGKPVRSVDMNEDMTTALSSSDDNTIRLWNVRTQELIGSPLRHQFVRGAKFIAGDRILSWSERSLKVWDCKTQSELINQGFKLSGNLGDVVFSPGKGRVFFWSDNHSLAWDFNTNTALSIDISSMSMETSILIDAKFLTNDILVLWDESNKLYVCNLVDSSKSMVLEHDGPVIGCQFREKDSKLLTWSEDNKARLWDCRSGNNCGTFDSGLDDISGALFHHDEQYLFTWSSSGAIRFWNFAGGSPVTVHHFDVVGANLLPMGKILSWSRDGSISIWDSYLPGNVLLNARMHHRDIVNGTGLSNQNIFTWSEGDGAVRIWKFQPQRRINLRHTSVIGAESISTEKVVTWGGVEKFTSNKPTDEIRLWNIANPELPFLKFDVDSSIEVCKAIDSKRILIGCKNGDVILWEDGGVVWRLKLPDAIHEFQLSKDYTNCLVLTRNRNAFLLRMNAPILSKIDLPNAIVFDGKFTNQQSLLLCTDKGIFKVSLAEWQSTPSALLLEKSITGGAVLENTNNVIHWNEDGTLRFWSIEGERIVVDRSMGFSKVAFSPNNEYALALGRNNAWLVDLKEPKSFSLDFHKNENKDAIVSDTRIITWAKNEIRLSSLSDQLPVAILIHQGQISDVQLSTDNSLILSSSEDRTSRIWDAESGDLLMVFEHDSIAIGSRFLEDTHKFVSWLDGEAVTIWNPAVPEVLDLKKRTGTTLTNAGQIKVMNAEDWQSLSRTK